MNTSKKITKASLKKYWDSICSPFDKEMSDRVYDRLILLYGESNRYYHNIDHIIKCLNILQEPYMLSGTNTRLISFAFFFHDAIYSTTSHDSEERSAEFARMYLVSMGMSEVDAQYVSIMIELSNHKTVTSLSDLNKYFLKYDIATFLDIDFMSGMMGTYSEFLKNSKNIRKEYPQYSDEEFWEGRKQFMRDMLDRKKKILLLFPNDLIRDNITKFLNGDKK